jgi:hypothetical protein
VHYFCGSQSIFHINLSYMEMITTYLIQALVGAGGGWLGNMLKANGLGAIGNLLAGAVGGVGAPAALGAAGLLAGGDNMLLEMVTSLVGGGLGSIIGGLFKKA